MPADTVPAVVVRDLTVRYGPSGGTVAVDALTLEARGYDWLTEPSAATAAVPAGVPS